MIREFMGEKPKISKETFIAKSSEIIGNVKIGENSSVWFNATIRGDLGKIIIGDGVSIQDNCVMHTEKNGVSIIEDNVVIGHGAIIHGSFISSNTIIGMGAILLTKSKIGRNCIIGAGSLVTEGTEIPDNSIAFGNPCKVVKQTTPENIQRIKENVEEYLDLAKKHSKEIKNKTD